MTLRQKLTAIFNWTCTIIGLIVAFVQACNVDWNLIAQGNAVEWKKLGTAAATAIGGWLLGRPLFAKAT